MAKQIQKHTFDSIMADLHRRHYAPLYYLMGEEAYYIDLIAEYIAETVLPEEERGFNQMVVYGLDTDINTIIMAAKNYPMMAEHQVIIVKEAQHLKQLDSLSYYLKQPMPQTVLVFCHKNGTLDRRKKIAAEIERTGVLFESKKLREDQLSAFITDYLKKKGRAIEVKAANMLAEYVGADLNRMVGEMDKLLIAMSASQTAITADCIEKNIGISKEFNNFELIEALITKDIYKANCICRYFADNTRKNPIQVTLAYLFNFFSKVMIAYYSPDKSSNYSVADFMGLKWADAAKDYIRAMKVYKPMKVLDIISEIRYCDARSKGVGTAGAQESDLLQELVFKILH